MTDITNAIETACDRKKRRLLTKSVTNNILKEIHGINLTISAAIILKFIDA